MTQVLHYRILNVLCFMLVLFLNQTIQAQTLAKDLEKVRASFNGSTAMEVDIEVNYYRFDKDSKPSISKKGKVYRMGKDYYRSAFAGMEYVINKKYSLWVNHDQKIMVIKNTGSGPDKNRHAELSIPELDPETEKRYHIIRAVEEGQIVYAVISKVKPDDKFKMIMDMGGSRLVKVIYYGVNSYARTEITYTYPPVTREFSPNDFAETRFVSRNRNKFVLLPAYSKYELNDQTK